MSNFRLASMGLFINVYSNRTKNEEGKYCWELLTGDTKFKLEIGTNSYLLSAKSQTLDLLNDLIY